MTDLLQQAIQLAKSGQKAEARELFQQVLRANPRNETAWVWFADCAPTAQQRIEDLETCLRILPNAQRIRLGLERLQQADIQTKTETKPQQAAEATVGVPGGTEPPDLGRTQPTRVHKVAVEKESAPVSDETGWLVSGKAIIFDPKMHELSAQAPGADIEGDPQQQSGSTMPPSGNVAQEDIHIERELDWDPFKKEGPPVIEGWMQAGSSVLEEDLESEASSGFAQIYHLPEADQSISNPFTVPPDQYPQNMSHTPIVPPLNKQVERELDRTADVETPPVADSTLLVQPQSATRPARNRMMLIFLIFIAIGAIGFVALLVGLILSR